MSTRLKGDETYKQCGYCHKPIRDDQDSTSLGVGGDEPAPFHGECFSKWCEEFPKRIAGGKGVVGTQTVLDTETGELMDEDAMRALYTETAITGKQVVGERMRLGQRVCVKLTAQVVAVGEELDKDGNKVHTQKLKVLAIDELVKEAL